MAFLWLLASYLFELTLAKLSKFEFSDSLLKAEGLTVVLASASAT